MIEKVGLDSPLIGRNVRLGRVIRGYSQEALAGLAGLSLSTVQHIEWGRRVHRRSILKVCQALETTFDSIRATRQAVLTDDTEFVISHGEEVVWTAGVESRPRVPADNLERIQNADERTRLGLLGFVPIFVTTPNFVMPSGPGLVSIELFGRFGEPLNAMIYRDALLSCATGRARVGVAGASISMGKGDVMGYRTKDLDYLEPDAGSELPVRLTWMGGTRIGNVSVEPGKRVRRRAPAREVFNAVIPREGLEGER